MTRNRTAVGIVLVTAALLVAGASTALAAQDESLEADQTGTDDSMNATETDGGSGMNDSMAETESGGNDSMTGTGMGDSTTDPRTTDSGMSDSGANDSMTGTAMDDSMTESETGDSMDDETEETSAIGPGFGPLALLAALVVGVAALAYSRSR